MNKQEKIDAIYEKVANKELGFWCRIQTKDYGVKLFYAWKTNYFIKWIDSKWKICQVNKRWQKFDKIDVYYLDNIIIKWHPVNIGDVFEYQIENLWLNPVEFNYLDSKLLWVWKNKRLPIEQQSEECINYVYDLIK